MQKKLILKYQLADSSFDFQYTSHEKVGRCDKYELYEVRLDLERKHTGTSLWLFEISALLLV